MWAQQLLYVGVAALGCVSPHWQEDSYPLCHQEGPLSYFYCVHFWLRWVFVAEHRLSLAPASRATLFCNVWASHCFSYWCAGSVVAAYGRSCFVACGIFRDQGPTPVPCTGRRVLIHCNTREILSIFILNQKDDLVNNLCQSQILIKCF